MLTTKNYIRNDPCRELHPETTPNRQFFFCVRTGSRRAPIIGSPGVRHSKFRKKGRMYMKAKKARTIKKTLQITVLCLFCGGISAPKGKPVLSDDWHRCCRSPCFPGNPYHPSACFRTPEIADSDWKGNGYRKRELRSGNHPDPADQLPDYRHTSVCFSGSHLGICRTPASFPPAGWRCDPLIYQKHR